MQSPFSQGRCTSDQEQPSPPRCYSSFLDHLLPLSLFGIHSLAVLQHNYALATSYHPGTRILICMAYLAESHEELLYPKLIDVCDGCRCQSRTNTCCHRLHCSLPAVERGREGLYIVPLVYRLSFREPTFRILLVQKLAFEVLKSDLHVPSPVSSPPSVGSLPEIHVFMSSNAASRVLYALVRSAYIVCDDMVKAQRPSS